MEQSKKTRMKATAITVLMLLWCLVLSFIFSCSNSRKIQKYIDKGIAKGIIDTSTKVFNHVDTLYLKDTSTIDATIDSIFNIIINSPCDSVKKSEYLKNVKPSVRKIIRNEENNYCSMDTTVSYIDKEKGLTSNTHIIIKNGEVVVWQDFRYKKFEVLKPTDNIQLHLIYIGIISMLLFLIYILARLKRK